MKISVDKSLHIGAAVSGGADSMVMLELLLEAGVRVAVLNVDHSIRGEISERDSAFVRDVCAKRGIPFLFRKVDAPAYSRERGISVELAARELRYAFFDELLAAKTVDAVALAHQADDQAETVLMRFFRGSGVRGLRGITDRQGYLHPLLDVTKDEIRFYAEARGIPFVQDETNADTAYRRNFIRHQAIPLLETRYPDIKGVLTKNARISAELEDYLLSEITPYRIEPEGVSLPLEALCRHPAIAKKSIAEAVRAAGVLQDAEYNHISAVYALKDAPVHARLNLPFGIDAIKEYDCLLFVKRKNAEVYEAPFERDRLYAFAGKEYSFITTSKIEKGVTFDADKLPGGCVVRTRRTGDLFRRYKGAEKSLSDYLTDLKLPAEGRGNLLVLAKDSRVFAVLGIETADSVKIDSNTATITKIVVNKGED